MLYNKVGNIIACVYCMFTILRVQFGLVWRFNFFLYVLILINITCKHKCKTVNQQLPTLYTAQQRACSNPCYFPPTFSNCYDYEITYLKCTVVYTYFTLIKNIENKTSTCFLATSLLEYNNIRYHTIPCVRTPTYLSNDRHNNCVVFPANKLKTLTIKVLQA